MHSGDKDDAVKVSKDGETQEESSEVGRMYEIAPVFFTNEDPGVDRFINYQKKFFERNFDKL